MSQKLRTDKDRNNTRSRSEGEGEFVSGFPTPPGSCYQHRSAPSCDCNEDWSVSGDVGTCRCATGNIKSPFAVSEYVFVSRDTSLSGLGGATRTESTVSQYPLVVGIRIRPGIHPRDRFADQTLDLGRRIVSIWGFDVHRGSNTRCAMKAQSETFAAKRFGRGRS